MPKIAAGATNKNISIAPHGTGKVVVGTGAADATVQSDGDHNLILQTGNSTTSKIEITDGANGDIAVTPNGTGNLTIDNIAISDNAIISTDTNGDIDITPNGTGEVNISKVDIDGGAIDGTDVTVGSGKTLDVSAGTLTSSTAQKQAIIDGASIEGTAVDSTGESGGTKFLREDGDGTCSWQTATGSDSLPDQSGNVDRLLTTDGTDASWTNAPINLVKLAFAGQSSAPGAPSAGTAYFDTTTNALKVYNGTSWVACMAGWITATGPDGASGTIDGDYKYHVFNATKAAADGFVVSSSGNSLGSNTVEYLVIAGGGSGGSSQGAGGGAGGYRNSFSSEASGGGGSSESAISVSVQGYAITVGDGGTSPGGNNQGGDGSPSTFSSITSVGGGGGGKDATAGRLGGSGGGGGYSSAGGAGTSNQGFAGGTGHGSPNWPTGGGGGAGAVGESPAGGGSADGEGGDGLSSSITGTSVPRAGGGGSVGDSASGSSGGTGGGGAGHATAGVAGGANTGSGGGGTGNTNAGGAGGKGVVIIRYKFQN